MSQLKQGGAMFIFLVNEVGASDWHVMRSFDPDQQEEAEQMAEDYLLRLPDGSQVAVAKIYTYGIVKR